MLDERLAAAVEADHGFRCLFRDIVADECLAFVSCTSPCRAEYQ
jgi:hypothetical protein